MLTLLMSKVNFVFWVRWRPEIARTGSETKFFALALRGAAIGLQSSPRCGETVDRTRLYGTFGGENQESIADEFAD